MIHTVVVVVSDVSSSQSQSSQSSQPLQVYTGENSLFAGRTASIWTVNCPCPMGARCRNQACHFARVPLSAECRDEFELQWSLFNGPPPRRSGAISSTSRTQEEEEEGEKEATATPITTTKYDALEALAQQDASLSLSLCRYGAECRSQHCHRLHTLHQILGVFARKELVNLYRKARIRCCSSGDEADTPRPLKWEVCSADQLYCHRTPQCAKINSYEYRLRLMQETSDALRYPACRVFCRHCRATQTVDIYE